MVTPRLKQTHLITKVETRMSTTNVLFRFQ